MKGEIQMNKVKKEGYTQVAVMQGMYMETAEHEEFVDFMKGVLDADIQVLECIETLPDKDLEGFELEGTGGRTDVLFAIKREHITGQLCMDRFLYGIRWLEDIIQQEPHIYPERIKDYCVWEESV
jgi:hypothetical protein